MPTRKARCAFVHRMFDTQRVVRGIICSSTTHIDIDTRWALPKRMNLHDTYPKLRSLNIILCPYNGIRALQHIMQQSAETFDIITELHLTMAGDGSPHLFPYPIGFKNALKSSVSLRALRVTGSPLDGKKDGFVVRSFRLDGVTDPCIFADMISSRVDVLLCTPAIAVNVSDMTLSVDVFKHDVWIATLKSLPTTMPSLRHVHMDALVDPSDQHSITLDLANHSRVVSVGLVSLWQAEIIYNAVKSLHGKEGWPVVDLVMMHQHALQSSASHGVLTHVRSISLTVSNFSDVVPLKAARDTLQTLNLTVCQSGLQEFPSSSSQKVDTLTLPKVTHLHVVVEQGAWDAFHRIAGSLVLPCLDIFEVDGVPEWFVTRNPDMNHLISSKTRCWVNDDLVIFLDRKIVIGPNVNVHLDRLLCDDHDEHDDEDVDDENFSVSSTDSDFSMEL